MSLSPNGVEIEESVERINNHEAEQVEDLKRQVLLLSEREQSSLRALADLRAELEKRNADVTLWKTRIVEQSKSLRQTIADLRAENEQLKADLGVWDGRETELINLKARVGEYESIINDLRAELDTPVGEKLGYYKALVKDLLAERDELRVRLAELEKKP